LAIIFIKPKLSWSWGRDIQWSRQWHRARWQSEWRRSCVWV